MLDVLHSLGNVRAVPHANHYLSSRDGGPAALLAEGPLVGLWVKVLWVSATCQCIDASLKVCAILPHSIVSQLFFNDDLDDSRKDFRVDCITLPYADWVTFSSWIEEVLPLLWDDSILKTTSETCASKCSWDCNTPPCQKHIRQARRLDPLSQDAVSLSQGHQGRSTPYIEDKLTPPEPWGILIMGIPGIYKPILLRWWPSLEFRP